MLVGGVVSDIAGGVALAVATSDQTELNRSLALKDGTGKIIGITKPEADAEQMRLDTQYVLGWSLAGVGAVGLGVGALLLATAPSVGAHVSLAPWGNGRGAGLTVRF